MNIVVLVKQVPGTDNVKMDPETGVMIRSGKDTIINPLDENALAEAIRIKNSHENVKVTAISMGPDSAIKALKEAIAMGADEGVLISGRAFAGSDTIATAKAIAAAIKKLDSVDLIVCGERATDGETGQTGAMIAHYLDIPVETYVSAIEVKETSAILKRTVEGGFERIEVPYPVMATVNKDINEPGFPTLKGKLQAKQKTIPVYGPEALGLEPAELGLKGSPTRVVKVFSPKLSRDTIMKKANGTTEPVDELIKFLSGKDVI
ncbi:electron transfer flavoprotein subunit beta/FixA family protein [Heliobacterium chlorum]|uniref:Electron transfer flavoprotein small subunit n=1 Tax=Heliobacterium chlorum TaxID=2698 RepID=A0ABR7SZG4_HELCL|nr:electron transfer flavoprotein subunit beta/FixA family protein [Heliobacterium chlorum]MBC9783826.1 electron transfer flavoprotein subunit beta/FixA family protein [Heliobacterium chlorum]